MATISLATTAARILPDLSKPSYEQLLEVIAKQQAELASAKSAKRTGALSCKVSAKGALSIYGLGQFPITLYISQFERIAAAWPDILAFVDAHAAEFTRKA